MVRIRFGCELGRVALARYDLHCGVLAALTALGLFFVGGVRNPGSWVLFALSVIAAVAIPRRFLLSRAADSNSQGLARSSIRETREVEVSSDSVEDFPRRSLAPRREPDDVDYLRALRHELRTPLNAVLGFADVLLSGIDGEVNESQREDLQIIRASGIRLRILLDSALDLAKIGDDDLRLDRERVDVCELVRRAANEAKQLWSNKRPLDCDVPLQPITAELDEARVRRSVLVLADYLATMHRSASMRMGLQVSSEHVAIVVSADTEEPITLDALPTITEVLASEEPNKIRQWPVAVSSELVGRHGGSLYHGARPTRFLLRLPKGPAS